MKFHQRFVGGILLLSAASWPLGADARVIDAHVSGLVSSTAKPVHAATQLAQGDTCPPEPQEPGDPPNEPTAPQSSKPTQDQIDAYSQALDGYHQQLDQYEQAYDAYGDALDKWEDACAGDSSEPAGRES